MIASAYPFPPASKSCTFDSSHLSHLCLTLAPLYMYIHIYVYTKKATFFESAPALFNDLLKYAEDFGAAEEVVMRIHFTPRFPTVSRMLYTCLSFFNLTCSCSRRKGERERESEIRCTNAFLADIETRAKHRCL